MEHTSVTPSASGDKTIAILVHISCILFGFLVPLIVYLVKKDDADRFTVDNAREALNFQITVMIGVFACVFLSIILIGMLLIWVVVLANFVLSILAAIKASNGVVYRYPLALRLIK